MIQETNPKQAAGHAAAQFVEAGMLVGLGTGSTASFFIDSLIERCRQGLTISAVATSEKSRQQATCGRIPLVYGPSHHYRPDGGWRRPDRPAKENDQGRGRRSSPRKDHRQRQPRNGGCGR